MISNKSSFRQYLLDIVFDVFVFTSEDSCDSLCILPLLNKPCGPVDDKWLVSRRRLFCFSRRAGTSTGVPPTSKPSLQVGISFRDETTFSFDVYDESLN